MEADRHAPAFYKAIMRGILVALMLPLMMAAAPPSAERGRERELMTLTAANMAEVAGVRRIDPDVLGAMRTVPRHRLVPDAMRARAYENIALPIGHGATISQPSVVLMMTQLLQTGPDHVVLEVGTGSGYQAAILSRLVRHVFSIEIVPELAERAARDLAQLGHDNVTVRAGDGYAGWPERAPFDRIIVTAGADHVPQPLLDQLRPGGVMVLPLGPTAASLELTVVRKSASGRISRRRVAEVRFVPLTRDPSGD
jgi:protein-L-isoaspartate(D-aspartate) O-methyltransferase